MKVVNYLLDELAYDKPGDGNESYLYWLSWANHAANTIFGQGDANGITRRGLLVIGCSGLETLDQLGLIEKTPRAPRSIKLNVPPEELPILAAKQTVKTSVAQY